MMAHDVFRTDVCDLLGIDYPIAQSGMGGVAGPDMVAEVSRAGALGILAGLNVAPATLRTMIRRVRELTDRPFGVNLWLHAALQPPLDPATLPGDLVESVQETLNTFRQRLGLSLRNDPPPRGPDVLGEAIDVILDERVPVFSTGLVANHDRRLVERAHTRGVKVMAMVATVADARAADASGVDVIVAQGAEAGGHRSIGDKPPSPDAATIGTIALLPQVVDTVRAPVMAAGGLADGRGLVAALALGASGVLFGTRFVATREAGAPEFWKKALLEHDSDATIVTDAFTGLWARALRNVYTEEYRTAAAPVLPPLVQRAAADDVIVESVKQRTGDFYPMWSGQSVGLIHDLPGAADVVQAIVREAREVLRTLDARVRR
jgi:nitronate monooxygenase